MDILIIPCFLFLFYYDLLLLNFPLFSNYPIFPQLGEKISLKFTINIYNISYLTFFTQNLKKKKTSETRPLSIILIHVYFKILLRAKKKKKRNKTKKGKPFLLSSPRTLRAKIINFPQHHARFYGIPPRNCSNSFSTFNRSSLPIHLRHHRVPLLHEPSIKARDKRVELAV